jgi:hypothetical protein
MSEPDKMAVRLLELRGSILPAPNADLEAAATLILAQAKEIKRLRAIRSALEDAQWQE